MTTTEFLILVHFCVAMLRRAVSRASTFASRAQANAVVTRVSTIQTRNVTTDEPNLDVLEKVCSISLCNITLFQVPTR